MNTSLLNIVLLLANCFWVSERTHWVLLALGIWNSEKALAVLSCTLQNFQPCCAPENCIPLQNFHTQESSQCVCLWAILVLTCGVLVPGPPWIQKTMNAQVPYVKWCRTMHTIGSLQIPGPKMGNTVFHLKLVESKDTKPPYMEDRLYFLGDIFPNNHLLTTQQ